MMKKIAFNIRHPMKRGIRIIMAMLSCLPASARQARIGSLVGGWKVRYDPIGTE